MTKQIAACQILILLIVQSEILDNSLRREHNHPTFIYRVKWLDFWLACRALDGLDEAKDGDGVKAHLGRMSKDFFGASSGVSLTNDSVRRECAQICSKGKTGGDLRPMWLAQG